MNEPRPETQAVTKVIDALIDLDEDTRTRVLDVALAYFRPAAPKRGRPEGSKNKAKDGVTA